MDVLAKQQMALSTKVETGELHKLNWRRPFRQGGGEKGRDLTGTTHCFLTYLSVACACCMYCCMLSVKSVFSSEGW
jgi:hypothetical protein